MTLSKNLYVGGRGVTPVRVDEEMWRRLERIGKILASRWPSVKWSPSVVARTLLAADGHQTLGEDSSPGEIRDAIEDALIAQYKKYALTP